MMGLDPYILYITGELWKDLYYLKGADIINIPDTCQKKGNILF